MPGCPGSLFDSDLKGGLEQKVTGSLKIERAKWHMQGARKGS